MDGGVPADVLGREELAPPSPPPPSGPFVGAPSEFASAALTEPNAVESAVAVSMLFEPVIEGLWPLGVEPTGADPPPLGEARVASSTAGG